MTTQPEAAQQVEATEQVEASDQVDRPVADEEASPIQAESADNPEDLASEMVGALLARISPESTSYDLLAGAFHSVADLVSINDDADLDQNEAVLYALRGGESTSEGATQAFVLLAKGLGLEAQKVVGEDDEPLAQVTVDDEDVVIDVADAARERESEDWDAAQEPWAVPSQEAEEDPQGKLEEQGEEVPAEEAPTEEPAEEEAPAEELAEEQVPQEQAPEEEGESEEEISQDDSETTSLTSSVPIQKRVSSRMSVQSVSSSSVPTTTNNVSGYNPVEHDAPRTSYLHVNSGSLERVEYVDGTLLVQTLYDSMLNVASEMIIPQSTYTPTGASSIVWGGFYSGSQYNFVVTGQGGVIRIAKYSKGWSFVNAAEFTNAKTQTPFYTGTVAMAELGGNLHVRTSHQMTDAHQATMHLVVNESSMTVTASMADVSNLSSSPYGYVSHSFAQRLTVLGNTLYSLDHGDAKPRNVAIKRIGDTASSSYSTLFSTVGGAENENFTGITVGGFASSTTKSTILSSGVSIDQSQFSGSGNTTPRNAYLTVTTSGLASTMRYLTSYDRDGTQGAGIPKLVKVGEDKFLVLWAEMKCNGAADSESNNQTGYVHYIYVDGNGNATSSEYTMRGYLSDCDPIMFGNLAVWYAEDVQGNHEPVYYYINTTQAGDHGSPQRKGDLRDAVVGTVPDQSYTGSAITPEPKVTLNGSELVLGTDYRLEYTNNTNVGVATATVVGINGYTSKQSVSFNIVPGTPTIEVADSIVVKTTDKNGVSLGATAPSGVKLGYVVDDTTIARVTLGLVKGLKAGTTTITVTTQATDNWVSTSTTVTVHVHGAPTVAVEAPETLVMGTTGIARASVKNNEDDVDDASTPKYTSSNKKVLEVDEATGELTPVGVGTATITATCAESDNWPASSGTATVTVTKGTPTITAHDMVIAMGETETIEVEAPEGVGKLTYHSSEEAVAKVSSSGVVTPITTGTATITVTTASSTNWESGTAQMTVTVTKGIPTITAPDVTVAMGKTATISASTPTGAGGLSYVSADEGIVEVSENGALTPVSVGTADVIVTSGSNSNWDEGTKVVKVTVTQGSPTIAATTKSVAMGTTANLGATITEGAGSLSYESSDPTVVKVDSAGNLTPVKVGKTTIVVKSTANANWNSAAKYVDVSVTKGTPTITVPEEETVNMGTTATIFAKASDGAGALQFTSSNTGIVTVDSNGVLTPVKAGKATITISSAANDSWNAGKATVPVTVAQGAGAVTAEDLSVAMGNTATIAASVPNGAGRITYLSTDDAIAKVSSSGVVTPVKAGTVKVIVGCVANSNYALVSKEITVTVTQGTPTIAASPVSVAMGKTARVSVTSKENVGGFSYISNNANVVEVDADGVLTPKGVGTATVTVTSQANESWKSASAQATVTVVQGTPTIKASNKTVAMGTTVSLGATITDGAGGLIYSSQNTDVATVGSDGTVTPVKVGTAKIDITSASSANWEAVTSPKTITVTVTRGTPTVTTSDVSVAVGNNTQKVTATKSAGDGAITFTSSNTGIVKVDSSTGVLTPVKAGETYVTARVSSTTNWNAATAKAKITVSRGTCTITASDVSLAMGTTASVGATVPSGAGKLTYSSKDESVVKVSSSGTLTPVKTGTANVEINAAQGTGFESASKTIKVTVTKGTPKLTVTETRSVAVGKTVSLGGSVTSGAALTYKSNRTDVATVDSAGKVTALKVGTATVTVSSKENSDWLAAPAKEVTVTVSQGAPIITASNKTVAMGTTTSLDATITNGAGALSYSSSNTGIAKVDSKGVVTPVKVGSATITITSAANDNWSSATKTVTVTVKRGTPTVTASASATTLSIGATAKVSYKASAGVGKATYTSNKTAVATVDSNGVVTAKGGGTATITVKTATSDSWNAGTATVTITVSKSNPTITASNLTVAANNTSTKIGATVTSGAGSLKYASSNAAVLTVTSGGVIRPVSAGTANVTITNAGSTNYNSVSKTIKVTITKATPTLSITASRTVGIGKTVSLGGSVTSGAGALTYKSNNTAVAKVSSTGVVTGVGAGTATITVSSAENGKWLAAPAKTVTVTVNASTGYITASNKSVIVGGSVAIGAQKPANSGALSYSSSNTSVAKVNAAGVITGVSPGTATITIMLARSATWTAATKKITVTVAKAGQPLMAKAAKKTVKFAKVKKKAVTVARPLTVSNAQGTVTYAKSSGKAAFKVNSKTGKVTVKKGTKKGTYTLKIKVTASGNAQYNAGSTVVTTKIVVK